MDEIAVLVEEFTACREILNAFGDANRQYLILQMMQSGNCHGIRVGEIAEKTNLSRPAVSHHIRILKNAGLIKMRREGTRNYYYFDADARVMDQLIAMLLHPRR